MKLLDVVHPAAKILVDISTSQDAEVMLSPPAAHSHLNLHHAHNHDHAHTKQGRNPQTNDHTYLRAIWEATAKHSVGILVEHSEILLAA